MVISVTRDSLPLATQSGWPLCHTLFFLIQVCPLPPESKLPSRPKLTVPLLH